MFAQVRNTFSACMITQTEICQSYYFQYNSYFPFSFRAYVIKNHIRYLSRILLLYIPTPSKGVKHYQNLEDVSQSVFHVQIQSISKFPLMYLRKLKLHIFTESLGMNS